jgi:hypothetical protein
MQNAIQLFSLFLFSVGAGLSAFSSKLEPQVTMTDVAAFAQGFSDYQNREQHLIAATMAGMGTGLMTLGAFGILVPLVRRLLATPGVTFSDFSARLIATIAIWIAVATTITFGVFRVTWAGGAGTAVVLLVVTVICASGVAATAMVFGWQPWQRSLRPPAGGE